jgi:hypothetical protein
MKQALAARWGWVLVVALSGCTSEDPGVSLDMELVHAQSGTSLGGLPRVLAGPNGSVVTLTRGWVNVGAVEIFACPPTAFRRTLRFLDPIGVAEAHTPGSPTKIGVPHVDDLARPDGAAIDFGTFKPPADTYCQAKVSLDAADADAMGLPAPSVVPMSGNTIWIEGSVSPAGGGPGQDFTLTSAVEVDGQVPFVGPSGSASPIALTSAGTARSARVVLRYDRWFATVDPLAAGAADALVSAIAQTLEVHAE